MTSVPKGGTVMNINKFTQKSMEAVQNCEKLAYEHGNQQLEQEQQQLKKKLHSTLY